MMGRQAVPERLFYDFSFETHIPTDHLLRKVDAALDFSFVTVALKVHYSDIGRPSVDPELMIRMLIVGYCYGIRFERRHNDRRCNGRPDEQTYEEWYPVWQIIGGGRYGDLATVCVAGRFDRSGTSGVPPKAELLCDFIHFC